MPSAKRKDTKGRNLRDNEFQKKDGRYEYRFTDRSGKVKSVYSWRLVTTDRTPSGKRECKPLREIETEIQRDLDSSLIIDRMATVQDYWEKMISKKQGLKGCTLFHYDRLYRTDIHPMMGGRKVVDIRRSDIEAFYMYIVNERGLKPLCIGSYHTVLSDIFEEAVRDEIIRINPVAGVASDLKRRKAWEATGWISKKKYLLSDDDQAKFIQFLKEDPYSQQLLYPMFICFLGTGCRFGEMASLCWEDVDFENRVIRISKSVRYYHAPNEHSAFHISTPKTNAGKRDIPMLSAVENVLEAEYERQSREGFCNRVVGGYTHFIWTGRNGNLLCTQQFDKRLLNAIERYNKLEQDSADKEGRTPALLKRFSAHNLRHAFCTRFCQNETDIKIIQEIMGHASITTTMNIYNQCNLERKQRSFESLDDKFGI